MAYDQGEAAGVLGMSRSAFREHVLPELRVVRRGRRTIISAKELERWLDANADSL